MYKMAKIRLEQRAGGRRQQGGIHLKNLDMSSPRFAQIFSSQIFSLCLASTFVDVRTGRKAKRRTHTLPVSFAFNDQRMVHHFHPAGVHAMTGQQVLAQDALILLQFNRAQQKALLIGFLDIFSL